MREYKLSEIGANLAAQGWHQQAQVVRDAVGQLAAVKRAVLYPTASSDGGWSAYEYLRAQICLAIRWPYEAQSVPSAAYIAREERVLEVAAEVGRLTARVAELEAGSRELLDWARSPVFPLWERLREVDPQTSLAGAMSFGLANASRRLAVAMGYYERP